MGGEGLQRPKAGLDAGHRAGYFQLLAAFVEVAPA